MGSARLERDKPVDLFKAKSPDEVKQEAEGRLAACQSLVVGEQGSGL